MQCRRHDGSGRLSSSSVFDAPGVDEGEGAVLLAAHAPAAFVDEPVVEGAEPGGVVEGRQSAFGPPDDVVAVGGWSAAAFEGASAVLFDPGGAAYGVREAAVVLAEVEDLGVAAEHGGDDAGGAGDASGGGGADGRPGGQQPQASLRSLTSAS